MESLKALEGKETEKLILESSIKLIKDGIDETSREMSGVKINNKKYKIKTTISVKEMK